MYLNGKIYKIAGCAANCGSSVANLEIYDITAGTWTAGAPLPQPIGFEMATAIGNFIYVAGGTVPASTNKTYRYDPSTNTWDDASIADLPATRWGATEGVVGGKWILAGGYVNDIIDNSAIAWDPTSNTWSAIDPMPQAEARSDGDAIGGTALYVVGGRTPTDSFVGSNFNQRWMNTCASGVILGTRHGKVSPSLTLTTSVLLIP